MDIREKFRQTYDREAEVFSAPGRVNLIGEHTDYNDGYVLPMAIERRTRVAATRREDSLIRCISTSFDSQVEFELSEELKPGPDWANHLRGVAACLMREEYRLCGADILIDSDLPLGAGLSSSAAIEVASGYALLRLAGEPVDLVDLALAAQRAEQEFTGTQCGIMDQYVACLGVRGHALLIDCRTLEYRAIPVESASDGARVVICNTMIRHDLTDGEYNRRRAECEEGVRRLAAHLPGIQALRDVEIEDFDHYAGALPDPIRRRCNHVITENARTLEAANSLSRGDLRLFGQLMYASHESLRHDYEVSCRELDLLVDAASRMRGVLGARMTGGGFGGCTVNLVETAHVDNFVAEITEKYEKETRLKPECYVTTASDGVRTED